MSRFWLLVFCGALVFELGLSDDGTQEITLEDKLLVGNPGATMDYKFLEKYMISRPQECYITGSNNRVFETYPKWNITDPNIKKTLDECVVKIYNLTEDHVGEWEAFGTTKLYNGTVLKLSQKVIVELVDIVEEEKLNDKHLSAKLGGIIDYNFLETKLNGVPIKCFVQKPEGVIYETYPLWNISDPRIEETFFDCAMKLRGLTADYLGEWRSFATFKPYQGNVTLITQRAFVTVKLDEVIKGDKQLSALVGKSLKYDYMETSPNGTAETCYIQKGREGVFETFPNWNITDANIRKGQENCSIVIEKLSKDYEGEWKAFGRVLPFNGSLSIITQRLIVSVEEEKTHEDLLLSTVRGGTINYDFLSNYLYGTAHNCYVQGPGGLIYETYPKWNITDPNVIESFTKCAFKIENVGLNYTGEWRAFGRIKAFSGPMTNAEQKLIVSIEEKVDSLPSNSITVIEGQNFDVRLSQKVENLKECKLSGPDKEIMSGLINHDTDMCDFTVKSVRDGMAGTWYLNGTGDITLFAVFNLTVENQGNVTHDQIDAALGAPTKFVLGPGNALFCRYTSPDGKESEMIHGQCVVDISKVTKNHEGLWNASVGVPEAMATYTVQRRVKVHDLGFHVGGRVFTHFDSNNSTMNVSCKLPVKTIESCRMVKPNGEVLMVNEGIGYGNYRYYVKENQSELNGVHFVECGIRVIKVTDGDKGAWKCIFVEEGGKETESWVQNDVKYFTNNTYSINAVKGSSFELSCEMSNQIEYCWFKNPNNTIYPVTQSTKNSEYEYVGKGFQAGQCGIRVKSAESWHTGEWKCMVGPGNGIYDYESRLRVNTVESKFYSPSKIYYFYRKINITCKMYDDSPLEYCLFIKPDGKAYNPSVPSKEFKNNGTDLTKGICSITVPEYYLSYGGKWNCIGKPVNEDMEYAGSFMFGYYSYYYSSGTKSVFYWFFGISFLLMSLLMLRVGYLCYKRSGETRRERRNDGFDYGGTSRTRSPPPYTMETTNELSEGNSATDQNDQAGPVEVKTPIEDVTRV